MIPSSRYLPLYVIKWDLTLKRLRVIIRLFFVRGKLKEAVITQESIPLKHEHLPAFYQHLQTHPLYMDLKYIVCLSPFHSILATMFT